MNIYDLAIYRKKPKNRKPLVMTEEVAAFYAEQVRQAEKDNCGPWLTADKACQGIRALEESEWLTVA